MYDVTKVSEQHIGNTWKIREYQFRNSCLAVFSTPHVIKRLNFDY